MRRIATILLVFGLLVGCDIARANEPMVVSEVAPYVQAATAFVVDRIGAEMYLQSMKYSGIEVAAPDSHAFAVHFEYTPPSAPKERVRFSVRASDSEPCRAINGPIPNCRQSPQLCDVTVSRSDAIQAARDHGLELGSGEWKTELCTFDGLPGIVWAVEARIIGAKDRVTSKTAVFDANTGRYIDTLVGWSIP